MKVGERYCAPNGSSAQIIVMRAPAGDVVIEIAGEAVSPLAAAPPQAAGGAAGGEDALVVGKRYVDKESGLEVLCTVAGAGPLSVDGRPIGTAAAKLLPSSD
ncbi:hypothetical protein P3H15_32085 [Rhodococcus sp. T2V]|uniref:hypothetical protein n=1 Tax=Rhodococcus sp. T2V TaxID=3034164 RepID=UPI0023E15D0E|nr:hypothetical protein [Rhodococcus sp. T2V]MDF3309659.1 hypothetical protein [Rhodococcus sp. T2V]